MTAEELIPTHTDPDNPDPDNHDSAKKESSVDSSEPSSSRLVLTLAIAGLISGIAIIGIFEATLATITANKARELKEAVFKVLPRVSQMQKLAYIEGQLMAIPEQQKDQQLVYGGYDQQGNFVGYAIPARGPGFQDTIGLLYGYLPDLRIVVGMEVLESRETPGLGDKIYKDEEFVAGFRELAIEPAIIAVKKGQKSRANEIDAITGATISSKAVVRIINEANQHWLPKLPPPGSEPGVSAAKINTANPRDQP